MSVPPRRVAPVEAGTFDANIKLATRGCRIVDGRGWQSEIYEQPPWPAEEKIVAEEHGSYLHLTDPS
jgi:hypothetical protein